MADFIEDIIENSPEWVFKQVEETKINEFARISGFDRRICKLFLLKNIRSEAELHKFLNDDFYSLGNPFLFTSMPEAVARVRRAVQDCERIFIFGDRDVDGVLSTAMLYTFLSRFDADVQYRVPDGEYGYGMEQRDIEYACSEGVGLIITVDTGISSRTEIEHARSMGIDVIVMDHHVPPPDYPEKAVVINPLMEYETYPFKELSAGGVTLKFIHAFTLSFTKNYNRVFIPLVSENGLIRGVKVKNGLIIEHVEFGENGTCPIEPHEVVVTETHRNIPGYFTGFLRNRRIKQLSIVSRKPDCTLEEFVQLFQHLFMKKQKKTARFVRSFIDLAAISTISDIMPLHEENRTIVREGLKKLPETDNLGLKVLLNYCNLPPGPLTTRDIAWNLSPVINSAGRMGNAASAVKLFTTRDPGEANELSRLLIDYNEKRKEKGERNLSIIRPIIEERCCKDPVIVLSTNQAEHGVTGIIASKIAKKFCRPAIIIVDDGTIGVGSGRGNGNCDLVALISQCEDLLVKYGGHPSAIGFTIETGNIDQFRNRIQNIVGQDLDLYLARDILEIDDVLEPAEITTGLLRKLDVFEPTGSGNKCARFSVMNTTVTDAAAIGKDKNHVKFFIPSGEGMVPVLGWGLAEKAFRILERYATVDIAFTIEENFFRETWSLQLVLLDIRGSRRIQQL
jgi:single-stranded-DNA-specific exonuclease